MPQSAFTKFEALSEHVAEGVIDFDTHTLRGYLSNAAPNAATHAVKADLAEIAGGNGYAAGGVDIENTTSRTGGITSVVAVDKTIQASGGPVGPFRYLHIYADDPTAPADPLVGSYDYGSEITLADGETFDLDFGAALLTLQ